MYAYELFSLAGSCLALYEALLRPVYTYLAENLELTELVPWLLTNEVLTSYDSQSIKACVSPYKQNCCLLDLMMMKSDQQIQTFIQGLIECHQRHLAQKVDTSGNFSTTKFPLFHYKMKCILKHLSNKTTRKGKYK